MNLDSGCGELYHSTSDENIVSIKRVVCIPPTRFDSEHSLSLPFIPTQLVL